MASRKSVRQEQSSGFVRLCYGTMGCLFGFRLDKGDGKMTIRSKMLGTVAAVFLVLFLMIGVVYLWGGSTLSSVLKGAGVESVSQSAQVF